MSKCDILDKVMKSFADNYRTALNMKEKTNTDLEAFRFTQVYVDAGDLTNNEQFEVLQEYRRLKNERNR